MSWCAVLRCPHRATNSLASPWLQIGPRARPPSTSFGALLSKPSSLPPHKGKNISKQNVTVIVKSQCLKLFKHLQHGEFYFWPSQVLSSNFILVFVGFLFFFFPDFLCPSVALYFIFLTFRALQFVEPRVSRCNGDNLITMTSLE